MKSSMDRRHFVQTSSLMLAGASALSVPFVSAAPAQNSNRIKKAVGWEMILEDLSPEDKLKLAKDVGFEGIEINSQQVKKGLDPKVLAKASEKVGIPIHGISNASQPDLKAAIDEAEVYGATSVLHVVRANPAGSFMENYRKTQDLIRAAASHAEKKRIHLLVENVWATYLIEPLTMARFIDEIGSEFVKSYFDVGNVMRWGYPQHWIEVLGKRIVKIHIKEYNLKVAMKDGMGKGFDFPLGQGDIDWKRVCEELKAIGFRSWATAEVRGGKRERLADIATQMDRVLNLTSK